MLALQACVTMPNFYSAQDGTPGLLYREVDPGRKIVTYSFSKVLCYESTTPGCLKSPRALYEPAVLRIKSIHPFLGVSV